MTVGKRMVVGITGKARSGKDTFAGILKTAIEMDHDKYHKVVSTALADPIRDMISTLGLGEDIFSDDNKERPLPPPLNHITPRELMTTLGTDWGRNIIDINIWTKITLNKILNNPDKHFIITDVRFDNEAQMIRDLGGIVIHIRGDRAGSKFNSHESENGVTVHPDDLGINNYSTTTLSDLAKAADTIIHDLY